MAQGCYGRLFVGMESSCWELIQSRCERCDGGVVLGRAGDQGGSDLRREGAMEEPGKDGRQCSKIACEESGSSCDSKGALDNPAKVGGGNPGTWILSIEIEGARRELAEVEGLGFDTQPEKGLCINHGRERLDEGVRCSELSRTECSGAERKLPVGWDRQCSE